MRGGAGTPASVTEMDKRRLFGERASESLGSEVDGKGTGDDQHTRE